MAVVKKQIFDVEISERFPSGSSASWDDKVLADNIDDAIKIAEQSFKNCGLLSEHSEILSVHVICTGQMVSVEVQNG